MSRSQHLRLALAGLLIAAAAGCDTCEQAILTRGNLDRVADVVVVNGLDGVSYAVAANPELQALRVVDLTEGRFVAAPNRFSPLSVPTGPDTRALALAVDAVTTAVDPTMLYALDGDDDVVQVVRLADAKGKADPFVVVDRIAVGALAVDVAAIRTADDVFVAVARTAVVEIFGASDGALVASVDLPAGAHASAIVADPFGGSFVVGDAALAAVHVVDIGAPASPQAPALRSLDVGGPVSQLAAGVVDVVDGLAPVVVALRSDEPALMAVRLFRPGFPEDRFAVLGGAALPSLGVEAYVPDARPGAAAVTVCCRGLSDDAIDAGEATDAFAAVWMADGDLVYVALAATTLDGDDLPPGRTLVRLIDDDTDGPGAPGAIDLNEDGALWVPAEGGDAFRPTVRLTTTDNFGAPPFVPLLATGTTLLLTWEGDIPRLKNLGGVYLPGTHGFQASRDLAARGARVGDVARFVQQDPSTACAALGNPTLRAVIDSVDGGLITVVPGDEFDDAVAAACLEAPAAVVVTVEAVGAFVVDDAGRFVGRLVADGAGAEDHIALSGFTVAFTPSEAGLPLRGSKLAVPLDPQVTTMGMNLSDTPLSDGSGALGVAAFVPTGISGGTLVIPDASADEEGAVVTARRMVLSSGSVDATTGLPLLFTCDEGETSPGRVESFR
jgi:hypothetical protein